jgi:hypothetical protein
MRRTTNPRISPFVPILIVIFIVLLVAWIGLRIHIARSGADGTPADGQAVSIFVTGGLDGYREPCG